VHIREGAGPPPPRHWPPVIRRRPPGESLPLWQAVPGRTLSFILRSGLQAAETHWTGERTVPCVGEGCGLCALQNPRWKGYLGAWSLQEIPGPRGPLPKGRCLVEVTGVARLNCPRLGLPGDALAGRRLSIFRRDLRRNAQVACRIFDDEPPPLPDKRPVDPRQGLMRLWTIGDGKVSPATLTELFDLWQQIPIEE